MLRNIFVSQVDTLMKEIVNAHVRCNVHAKHMHVVKLSTFMKKAYMYLKRKYKQQNIEEMSRCYIHIQYVDKLIRTIYEILDKETIEEYEIYRDSVNQTIIKDIDSWIDSSFNYHPFCIHT